MSTRIVTMIRDLFLAYGNSLCGAGIWFGALFFAASLTPSLLPRDAIFQGVLSGVAFACGYGLGVFLRALWRFLEIPPLRRQWLVPWLNLFTLITCAFAAILLLYAASDWQNSVRARMELAPVESARPFLVGLISLLVAFVLIMLARAFRLVARFNTTRLKAILPRKVAVLAGTALTLLFFWLIGSGVLVQGALRALDSSYRGFDALIEDDIAMPTDPLKSGSAASLLQWSELGRAGRAAIASRPTRQEMQAFTGQPAMEPLRVYVGLRSGDTVDERAQLALDELIRIGGFERSILVIATPTGTGWLDPASHMALEYLHRGDVATVSVQYSYLTSWLALLVEPTYGSEQARALFSKIYTHWTALPQETRPKLYLHGLSLGAMNSDLSTDLFDVISDPFDGALWSGPPFTSKTWNMATSERMPGTPAWLPRFRDGAVIRFTNQRDQTEIADTHWGRMRLVYLQYASDPIVFFNTSYAWQPPPWLSEPRGPDVSPNVRWFPIVTFLQLLLDMATATTTPIGYGHIYAPAHYVDAWIAVTDPQGWNPAQIMALKEKLAHDMPE
ncbi:alpha/beta hydrolase [Limoniibacter endophyticus]|uniref:Membrane protein n=1 Tax=Limoniibacter endophyticus TaxID=1565040 RepID=A0A8J3GF20_9HYPH|nr:alpha/beta-hydrolase family protein [Limoniibacter endophyticus]GHC64119.1 membrane protein [Limoniibacter endophyticus]